MQIDRVHGHGCNVAQAQRRAGGTAEMQLQSEGDASYSSSLHISPEHNSPEPRLHNSIMSAPTLSTGRQPPGVWSVLRA